MPVGVWTPDELVVDKVATSMSKIHILLDPRLRMRHRVGSGYFDNGVEQVLTVLDFNEIYRTDGLPGVPEELLTIRTVFPVGFPADAVETAELMDLALYPVLPPAGGSDGDDCYRISGGLQPSITRCTRPTAFGQPGRALPGKGLAGDGSDNSVLANPAGLACLEKHTGCRTTCDGAFLTKMQSCDSIFIDQLLNLSEVCLVITGTIPITGPAGFIAAEACQIGGTTVVADNLCHCKQTGRKVRQLCWSSCASDLNACCAKPDADCNIPVLIRDP